LRRLADLGVDRSEGMFWEPILTNFCDAANVLNPNNASYQKTKPSTKLKAKVTLDVDDRGWGR